MPYFHICGIIILPAQKNVTFAAFVKWMLTRPPGSLSAEIKRGGIFIKIRKKISAVFLILCLLISGCGAESGAENETESKTESETDKSAPDSVTASGDSAHDEVLTGNKLYIKERQSIQFNEPEEGYQTVSRFYDIMDGKIYLFRVESPVTEADGRDSQRICMQTFDSGTRAVEQNILTPEIPGHKEYAVYSAALTSDGDISLKLTDPNGEGASFFLARVDRQGNVLDTADPFPDEEKYPWNISSSSGKEMFHLADGRTILSAWNMDTFSSTLTWLDGQTFTQIQDGSLDAICSDGNGIFYCLAGGRLLRLDSQGNIQDELLQLNENGIEYGEENALFLTDEGMLLCGIKQEEVSIYVLTDQKIINEKEIRMACLDGTVGQEYIQRLAANFPYETGGLPVNMETAEDEAYQEDYRNRIMAELVAGKGPDMLLLRKTDLALLAEKDYLCDLSDMIPEDIKSELFPAALELGTVNGKLAAITAQLEFCTMVTGDVTWEKGSWNIAEFKELAESRDDWEILASYLDSSMSFYTLYWWMFGNNLADSSLLDLEQGVSHLDSDEYVEILELCKKYSEKKVSLDGAEIDALLKEGKIAAKRIAIYNLRDFSAAMSRYGEGYHFVGNPSENGKGNYAESYSFQYLAVNRNSPHKEEIKKFLAYLLSYNNQFTVDGCSVRKDVIRDSVMEDSYYGYIMRMSPPDADVFRFYVLQQDVKPDGTPWLEEFLDFAENSIPEPNLPDQLSTIIGSELFSYYEEGRSSRETADNIQNRVQIYLDENK